MNKPDTQLDLSDNNLLVDATLVHTTSDAEIPLLSPSLSPAVLNSPIVGAVLSAIANHQHSVVKRVAHPVGRVKDAAAVPLEHLSVETHRERAYIDESLGELLLLHSAVALVARHLSVISALGGVAELFRALALSTVGDAVEIIMVATETLVVALRHARVDGLLALLGVASVAEVLPSAHAIMGGEIVERNPGPTAKERAIALLGALDIGAIALNHGLG